MTSLSPAQSKALRATLQDPVEFIKRLQIRLKDGKVDTFGNWLLPQQEEIINAIHNNQRVAIIKSRQLGISTVCRGYAFWEAYTSGTSLNSAVVSNKSRSSYKLLDIDRRFYHGLPPLLKQPLITDKRDELGWLRGSISAFSGAATDDRGYSLNTIHMSEFAFIDNAADVLASAVASVNSGKVILESTPNHYGDHLHKIAMDAMYNDSWKVLMLPWSIFPEYQKKVPPGFILDLEEEKLMVKHGLTQEQVFWRRCKVEEIKDINKFKREYPLDLEEAYSLSDKNYFAPETFSNLQQLPCAPQTYNRFQERAQGHAYVIGVDVAGGTGNDYSVSYVLDVSTFMPVAIFASNTISIHDFAEQTCKMAGDYNNAYICFEQNNHGHAFKSRLDALGYSKYEAFTTTTKSKLQLYDILRTYLADSLLTTVDSITYQELRNLIKNDALAPTHPPQGHDDRVMALNMALWALRSVPRPKSPWDKLLQPADNRKPTAQPHPLR